MIGDYVVWNLFDKDTGKPTLNLRGQVMAIGYHNFEYRILIKTDTGELKTAAASDIKIVAEADYLSVNIDKLAAADNELADIWTRIETLGLAEEVSNMTVSGGATWLLEKLVAELKDMGETHEADEAKISVLLKERDEALARAREAEKKAAKPPKPPKTPPPPLAVVPDEPGEGEE